jgi:Transposase and inactivated derivatives
VANNPVKSQTRLTPERRAELVADYEAGMPVRAICAKYGVHRGTISALARRAGVAARRPGLTDAEQTQAASFYAGGMTLMQVARHMRISDEAVRRAVLAEGGHLRHEEGVPTSDVNDSVGEGALPGANEE